jgi:hypothetical protein
MSARTPPRRLVSSERRLFGETPGAVGRRRFYGRPMQPDRSERPDERTTS